MIFVLFCRKSGVARIGTRWLVGVVYWPNGFLPRLPIQDLIGNQLFKRLTHASGKKLVNTSVKATFLTVFAIAVIASGCIRFFTQEGGSTGLWFGIVMGVVALGGVAAFKSGKTLVGYIIGYVSVVTVGGWFVYEALIKKGFAVAEVRQLIIIGFSLLALIVLSIPNKTNKQESAS